MGHLMSTFQLISKDKVYNDDFEKYLKRNIPFQGKQYHLLSILGSQSSGKSTLLNGLFGTGFQVMSQSSRAQTTQGFAIIN